MILQSFGALTPARRSRNDHDQRNDDNGHDRNN
jgi:hypothetical protein